MEPKSILMYNLNSEKGRTIKMLCLKNRIRIREVRPEQYLEPIGYLAGMKEVSSNGDVYEGQGFEDEMLIFRGFDGQSLPAFLKEMARNKVERIALKAVITSDNVGWTSIQLHEEIKKEHEALR